MLTNIYAVCGRKKVTRLRWLDAFPPLPRLERRAAALPPQVVLPRPIQPLHGAIQVTLQDRWLILGTSGSGKTLFSKELIRQLAQIWPTVPRYILDSKMEDDFLGWPGIIEQEDVPPPLRTGTQVWRPVYDNLATYEEYFEQLLAQPGPAIIYVDETSSIANKRGESGVAFQKLLKQGRSKHKCFIGAAQETAYIPRQLVTQATHFVRFRLVGRYDPRYGNVLVGRDEKADEPRHKYGFVYARSDRRAPTEYERYQEFFGGA